MSLIDRPIVTSMLDDDKYNFHMGNFFLHRYPGSTARYTYKCRDYGINFRPIHVDLEKQIQHLGDLKLTLDEAHWMAKNTKCSDEYIELLLTTRILDPKNVKIQLHPTGGMDLSYGGSPELEILREVKLLEIISELHFLNQYKDNYAEVIASTPEWISEQIVWLSENAHPKLRFFEAGGRRRFSRERHEQIVNGLWTGLPKQENGTPKFMMGTSNCMIGMKYDIPTFGTQAHQLYMFMQTVTHPALSQIKALTEWHEFYNGELSIALSDTLGERKWDRDFTKKFMEDYLGQRQDSGNPAMWGTSRLDAYRREGIDTKTKSFTFGDSLNWVKGNELTEQFSDDIDVNLLIGTFISNSLGHRFPNHKALSQVAKMTWANGLPTCKLGSDSDFAKTQCEDISHLSYMKTIAQNY